MGWEPQTYCRECSEPFDVYMAPDERVCDGCIEWTCPINYPGCERNCGNYGCGNIQSADHIKAVE